MKYNSRGNPTELLRINIYQNTPGFDERRLSKLLWLQPLQAGTALLPLVNIVATHRVQK